MRAGGFGQRLGQIGRVQFGINVVSAGQQNALATAHRLGDDFAAAVAGKTSGKAPAAISASV